MNAVVVSYDEMDASYAADFGRDREPMKGRSRRPEYRRAGSAPSRVNGIHCRRSKRWTWGSGRGARMLNVRAFAGCLAFALASVAASASAVTVSSFSMINVPGGNPANTNGRGAVATDYQISQYETTNAQYVTFLNAVDPTGANTRSLYNSNMAGSQGGIVLTATAAAGSKYSTKSSWANRPVNWVTWNSAARFVNWLANGGASNPSASTEAGTYNFSGTPTQRAANATVFLPSQDQWYKAAFYRGTGSSYANWGTNATPLSNAPAATSVGSAGTAPNQGNLNNVNLATGGVSNVGIYTNQSTSFYQLYDMMGNVAEMTDTFVNANSYVLYGGSWAWPVTGWDSLSSTSTRLLTQQNAQMGFRIATVAPVPEPGTIAMALSGLIGLVGTRWIRRRKPAPQAAEAAAA